MCFSWKAHAASALAPSSKPSSASNSVWKAAERAYHADMNKTLGGKSCSPCANNPVRKLSHLTWDRWTRRLPSSGLLAGQVLCQPMGRSRPIHWLAEAHSEEDPFGEEVDVAQRFRRTGCSPDILFQITEGKRAFGRDERLVTKAPDAVEHRKACAGNARRRWPNTKIIMSLAKEAYASTISA